jgi:hypothetical protein
VQSGGGAVAGSYTASGTTTTWVPLLDQDGSTLGLVNAAQVDSPPATTYTYDPSGNPTASGTPNDWPFQYQGMEKEFTDPAPYYYSGGGQFYSPQLVRSLSETGQTSSSGPGGGPSGSAIAGPSGGGGGGFSITGQLQNGGESIGVGLGAQVAESIGEDVASYLGAELIGSYAGPVGIAAATIYDLVSLFEDLFGGGGSSPETPRQLLHGRHPLYPVMLGVSDGLIPDEAPAPVLAKCDLVQPPSSSTLALGTALEAAGAADALGGGPEDPAADLIAASIVVYAGATACYEAYQSYAKGGKQNLRDTGLAGLSDDEISRLARDPSLPPQERRRYQREEKVRKMRNKRKRQ